VVERSLIFGLLLASVLIGTGLAITRPLLYKLGQEGAPRASSSSGVNYRGRYRGGLWMGTPRRRDWGGFQGRGPGGAK
jgi:hypothetical protein